MQHLGDDIIGHKAQCAFLAHMAQEKQTGHAYAFIGPKGLGKAFIAKRFFSLLVGLAPEASLHAYPDYQCVESDKESESIKVDQIRELTGRLSHSTFSNGKKIALIDEAHTMNHAAQNALLKTLEECSGDALIVLIVHKEETLLPTILSRVAVLRFHCVGEAELLDALAHIGIENSIVQQIMKVSLGRPGVALQIARGKHDLLQWAQDAHVFLSAPVWKRMQGIETLTKARTKDPRKTQIMIELWRMWLREALHANIQHCSSTQSVCPPALSAHHALLALRALDRSERAMQANVSPALALQVFASSF